MENKSNQGRGRWKLLLVLAVCAAPLVGSYLTYYVIKPKGGVTNYGALIDPREHPIPAMASTTLDGKPATLENYKGKWIMLKVGPSDCKQDCQDQLFAMRQLRTMQGKEMERIERVWLITDDQPLDTLLMRVNDGTRMLRAPAAVVEKWLPLEQGAGDRAADHVYLIDPLGNLMMRFPKGAVSSDTEKVKKVHKDISKLLKASAIG
ncbi:cytochrome C oxidase subunit I [Duganella sp. BJB488]|uniref:SCO family protein n=1 Tax=unclassified Duganella TaxID=2636909 RepID=UPI000E34543D|nr:MULTISPECIES: redoxin domain-containing protein [unclassified Duganella]RFP22878.1 cytochrome C oxidase subunit I [Duganella sp. BJB489]RFP25046.1 cytochrome C oxidase subunit I [Duganella sp. BJB488]RFP33877.1 cytochrome C oxidase subunit I [Duganella sp. BJB480]